MDMINIDDFELQNDSLRIELRSKKLDYIYSMHDIMKYTMTQYLKAYNNPIQVAKNPDEEAYFSAMPEEMKKKPTISLSGTSAFMLKKIKTADPLSYIHGMPVEFFAHCKMVYPSANGPSMAVTDPYRTITVSFPYHTMTDVQQLAGKYVLLQALIKNGKFVCYGYQVNSGIY